MPELLCLSILRKALFSCECMLGRASRERADLTNELVVESWDALWQRDGAAAMANATREMLLGDWTTRGRDAAPTRASVLVYYPGDLAAIEAARELGIPARSHLQLWEGHS